MSIAKVKPSVASTGRKQDGDAGSVSRCLDSITRRSGGQALRLPSGRIGGVIFEDVLRKTVEWSKHYHRRLRAWGIDATVLLEARERGVRVVEIVDMERGETWHADIDFIITHGLRFDFGHGLQCFLPLKDWRLVGSRAEPNATQLSLFGE